VLLSIFTPTHHPTYLHETFCSVTRQSYEDWEWVLVPNGKNAKIPDHIADHPKVRIIGGAEKFHNIGAIKKHACSACRGEAFIELDHDDLLMPGDTLSTIAEKIDKGAGFVYSDAAVFRPNKNETAFAPHTWSSEYGWQSYPVDFYGRTFRAARCFELSARMLSEIYYAPDHVRVWSRKAYDKTGGHDPRMSVGDDHDLMIRTYLEKFPFMHTGGCHYMYRLHQTNTVHSRNKKIQQQVSSNRRKYTFRLMKEEVRRRKLRTVNMERLWKEGWRFERDLKNGVGPTDTVGLIICHNVLQWCPNDRVAEFMTRCYNALVPGGYMSIQVPSTDARAGWMDTAYKSHFNASSFHAYCRKGIAEWNRDIRCRFQYIQGFNEWPSHFHKTHDLQYAIVHLAALKGQRHPGPVFI